MTTIRPGVACTFEFNGRAYAMRSVSINGVMGSGTVFEPEEVKKLFINATPTDSNTIRVNSIEFPDNSIPFENHDFKITLDGNMVWVDNVTYERATRGSFGVYIIKVEHSLPIGEAIRLELTPFGRRNDKTYRKDFMPGDELEIIQLGIRENRYVLSGWHAEARFVGVGSRAYEISGHEACVDIPERLRVGTKVRLYPFDPSITTFYNAIQNIVIPYENAQLLCPEVRCYQGWEMKHDDVTFQENSIHINLLGDFTRTTAVSIGTPRGDIIDLLCADRFEETPSRHFNSIVVIHQSFLCHATRMLSGLGVITSINRCGDMYKIGLNHSRNNIPEGEVSIKYNTSYQHRFLAKPYQPEPESNERNIEI